jgi:uncharacterized membrane protein
MIFEVFGTSIKWQLNTIFERVKPVQKIEKGIRKATESRKRMRTGF